MREIKVLKLPDFFIAFIILFCLVKSILKVVFLSVCENQRLCRLLFILFIFSSIFVIRIETLCALVFFSSIFISKTITKRIIQAKLKIITGTCFFNFSIKRPLMFFYHLTYLITHKLIKNNEKKSGISSRLIPQGA